MTDMTGAMRRLFRRRAPISALMRARRRVRRCKDSGLRQQSSYQLYCCHTHLKQLAAQHVPLTADRSNHRIRSRYGRNNASLVFYRVRRPRGGLLRRSDWPRGTWISGQAPKSECDWHRLNLDRRPPRCLIAMPVKLAMMQPANRNGKFIADLSPERARLGKAQVMWVRR